MKKLFLTLILALFGAMIFAQDQVTAPKIISTTPDFADCSVDPELKEIVIK